MTDLPVQPFAPLSVGSADIDAAYCRAKHGGEHLFRQEGCGSYIAKAIWDALDKNARPSPTRGTYAVDYIGDCAESKWPCILAGEPHGHTYVAVLVADSDAAVEECLTKHPDAKIESVAHV